MRTLAIILGFLLVVLGWSALWIYAYREAGQRIDGWLRAEAAQGRMWTCPNRTIGGYPLAITVACSDPTFAGQALGQAVEATLAHVAAEASLLHPRRIALTLQAPFTYKTSDGQTDISGAWSGLDVGLRDLPDIRTLTVSGTDLSIKGLFAQAGQQGGQAKRLEASFDRVADQPDPTIGFRVTVDDMPIAALNDLAGGTDPVAIDLVGRIDRVEIGDARTPEDAMERWREAGGRIDLGPSRLARGASRVSATGTLALDNLHRPQGRLAAQFVGLEPVLKRYGISANLAAAGSLLGSLFGGGPPPSTPTEPGALSLPISFQNGRLGIGPIRTQVQVPPLY